MSLRNGSDLFRDNFNKFFFGFCVHVHVRVFVGMGFIVVFFSFSLFERRKGDALTWSIPKSSRVEGSVWVPRKTIISVVSYGSHGYQA